MQVPAYSVSPQAVRCRPAGAGDPEPGQPLPDRPGAAARPESSRTTKTRGSRIGGSNIASLIPQGRREQDALKQIGYKVTTLQEKPPLVDNFRPYMEQIKRTGATAYNEIVPRTDITPEIQAINNVGLNLDYLVLGTQFYDQQTIDGRQGDEVPADLGLLQPPAVRAVGEVPGVPQIKSIMAAGVTSPKYNDFTALAFNAWTLWAKSATACGNDLTQACVLQKAGSETAWTAGGLFPPRDTNPANPQQPTCYVMMKVTPNGFVYDPDVTQPNNGRLQLRPEERRHAQEHLRVTS